MSQALTDLDLDMTDSRWPISPEYLEEDLLQMLIQESPEQPPLAHQLYENQEHEIAPQYDFALSGSNPYQSQQTALPQMMEAGEITQFINQENDEMHEDIAPQISQDHSASIEVLEIFDVEGFQFSKISIRNPHRCSCCDQEFASNASLWEHIKRSHSEQLIDMGKATEPEQCTHCGQWFKNATNLGRHVVVVHRPSKLKIMCEICNACFTTPHSATAHKREAHGIIPAKASQAIWKKTKYGSHTNRAIFYRCETCHYCSKAKGNVKRHIDIKHKQVRKYICQCGQAFKTKHNLESHQISKYCAVGMSRSMGL